MVKKKKGSVVTKKGKVENWNIGFTKGDWFNPLVQDQKLEGVFLKTFQTDSKFKNTRENSAAFGKKAKVNYEFARDGKNPFCIGETSGPLQALFDSLSPGDRLKFTFKHLKREDGEVCPKTVKTFDQLKKWKGSAKAWPVWGNEATVIRAK